MPGPGVTLTGRPPNHEHLCRFYALPHHHRHGRTPRTRLDAGLFLIEVLESGLELSGEIAHRSPNQCETKVVDGSASATPQVSEAVTS